MTGLEGWLIYVAASVAVVVVPGPTVSIIIANSLRHGARAGLLNVAGTQAGLAIVVVVLAFGLQWVMVAMAQVFDWLRLAGAVYLAWLGIKLLRSHGAMAAAGGGREDGFFRQGLFILLANPKVLLFFGAFIPQFIDPAGSAMWQTIALGATFMAVAAVFDAGYAFAAGGAGRWLRRSRLRVVEIVSGTCLIGGGIWLALARR